MNVMKNDRRDSHTQRTENIVLMASAFSASSICFTAWEQFLMSMEGHWDPRRMYRRLWVELCNRCFPVLIAGLVQWALASFKILIAVMVLVFLILIFETLVGWLA
jgi:hypothetical protein